jgi:hypothetical protein
MTGLSTAAIDGKTSRENMKWLSVPSADCNLLAGARPHPFQDDTRMATIHARDFQLRTDVSVYNESLLFVIASKKLGGKDCAQEPGSAEWNELVHEGVFLPVMLNGDKGINLRLIVNGELTPEEKAESFGSFASRLQVRDGKLALLGGSEYLEGEEADEFMHIVKIPKGDYRADVYACFAGVNGAYLPHFEEQVAKEPLVDWFRRTRPGIEAPRWLADHCRITPVEVYEDPPEYLDFILRLTPWDDNAPLEPLELDEQGCIVMKPAQLERCPVGLVMDCEAA